MVFRRRRRPLVRAGALALSLASYLLSIGPATAGVVYCISHSGHSGFELVAAGQQGCSPECGDEAEGPDHEGLQAEAGDCTDVALSLPQNVRRTVSGDPAPAPTAFAPFRQHTAATEAADAGIPRSQTALSPPRSAPSILIASTVLTI